MPSNYTGSGTTVHTDAPLPIDSDRPSAQLFRTPFELIFDSLFALENGAAADADAVLRHGTTTLTATVTIANGSGFEWRYDGLVRLLSGSQFVAASGSFVNVFGGAELNVKTGATATIESGGSFIAIDGSTVSLRGTVSMTSTAELNLASGADIVCSGGAAITVEDIDDIVVNADDMIFHVALAPAVANGWDPNVSPVDGTWIMGAAVGDPDGAILFPLALRFGDTVDTLAMVLDGGFGAGHPGSFGSFDVPILQLIRVNEVGAVTVIAECPDASANFAAYDVSHSVLLDATSDPGNMPYTNASSDVHYVRIIAEGGAAGVSATTRLTSVNGLGTARSYRRSPEVWS